jgi:predicted HicB family RNase H-like nuclease
MWIRVDLPPELHRRLKILAARSQLSLKDLVEKILTDDIYEWEIKADA